MAITPNLKHTWNTSIKNDSGSPVVTDAPLTITGDAETNWAVQVPAGETAEVDAPITVADIKSAFISSNVAVDVKTNAVDASGGQTINVAAGRAVAWNNQMTTVNPFTPNITKFFIHNGGTTLASVRGGFLLQE